MSDVWTAFFVRHVDPEKRDEIGGIADLLTMEMLDFGSSSMLGEEGLPPSLDRPDPPWLIVTRFADCAWWPVYASELSMNTMFELNAQSRRLETALIGCEPDGEGWFARIQSAKKNVLRFSQPIRTDQPTLKCKELPAGFLTASDGRENLQAICERFELPFQRPKLVPTDEGLDVIRPDDTPVTTELKEYRAFEFRQIRAVDAQAILEAARQCDGQTIRDLVGRGVPLDQLHQSPILWVLPKIGDPRAAECIETLFELGCDDDPGELLHDVVFNEDDYTEEEALAAAKLMLHRGADVNYREGLGKTTLLMAALACWPSVVDCLLQHGADPTITYWDEPAIDRVRRAAEAEDDSDRRAAFNTIVAQMQSAAK